MSRKVAIGLLAGVLVLGVVPAASPISVSYVYSDSMEPTLDEGDGYVLVPAGTVEEGDVITFYAPERDDYVTHRVVRKTERGYVTAGDANPTTDQASGLGWVQRDQVVGEVLTVAGSPVVLPGLGSFVASVRGSAGWLLGLAVAVLVLGELWGARSGTTPNRKVLTAREVVMPVLFGALVASVVVLLGSGQHTSVAYAVTADGNAARGVLQAGETVTRSHVVRVARPPFTLAVIDTEGMTELGRSVHRTSDGLLVRSEVTLRTRIRTPESPGRLRTAIHLHTYPLTLPPLLIRRLHAIHPAVASTGVVLPVFLPIWVGYWLFVDGDAPIRAPRSRLLRRVIE